MTSFKCLKIWWHSPWHIHPFLEVAPGLHLPALTLWLTEVSHVAMRLAGVGQMTLTSLWPCWLAHCWGTQPLSQGTNNTHGWQHSTLTHTSHYLWLHTEGISLSVTPGETWQGRGTPGHQQPQCWPRWDGEGWWNRWIWKHLFSFL